MKNWKFLFSEETLKRGKELYEGGHILILSAEGTEFWAHAFESNVYDVTAGVTDSMIPNLYCNCPHAAGGNLCEHMAALLYAIEEEEKA